MSVASCVQLFVTAWTVPSRFLVHGILRARVLGREAAACSRGPSRPRGGTCVSGTAGRFFTIWPTREAHVELRDTADSGRVMSGSRRELSHSSVFLPQVTSIAEVLCLTAFFGRLVHFAKVTPQKVFWKDTKNICVMVTIVVSAPYGAFERRWSKAESYEKTR